MRARICLLIAVLLTATSMSLAQQWFSVQTDHLISYSEGNDHGARDAAQRSEQLIAVFGQVFHRKDITFATPPRVRAVRLGMPAIPNENVLVRTPAEDFITVDLAQPESWAQAAKSISALTLENNYPRAQPWFDFGIANYLGGVKFTGEEVELGALPPGMVLPQAGQWIPLAKLFQTNDVSQLTVAQRENFEAESWALVRWLIDNSRLAQAGAYLNAVQSRGATPERVLNEAFSMSSAELDSEVRQSLAKLTTTKMPAPRIEGILFKSRKVSTADVHVLQASLSLYGPDSDRTLKELVAFMRQNQENAAVHRALAWAFLLRNDLDNAVEHIRRALALDDSDPSMHYLYARWVNQGDENQIRIQSAEARMNTELKAALKRDPNYAAALELLGLAQLSGEDTKPALANLQRASALRPRNSRYYLNAARAQEASGNLDAARNLATYARSGADVSVSADALEFLNQLGKQRKQRQEWAAMGIHTDTNVQHTKYDNLQEAIEADEKAEAKAKAPEPTADNRKTEFMKGRIVSVECGSDAGATLKVSSGGSTWRIQVADRNAAVLIGAEHFDCNWHNAVASINYKQKGSLQGELISLEIH